MKKRPRSTKEVVLLRDLVPGEEVRGGAADCVFGDVDAPRYQPERTGLCNRKR